MTIVIMTIMVVISIIMTILLIVFMKNAQNTLTKCVVMPVDEVAKAAEQMARGDLNVAIDYHANDEFDILARDLENSTRASMNIVNDISNSLNEISEVIQNNSATAEESSAVSSELSDQSNQLHNLMSQFQVKLV